MQSGKLKPSYSERLFCKIYPYTTIIKIHIVELLCPDWVDMLNCYCQLSSSTIFRQYGVSQTECKIDRPGPGLSRLSPCPHTKALGTRLELENRLALDK